MTGLFLKFKRLIFGVPLAVEIRLTKEVARSVALLSVVSLVAVAAYFSKQDRTNRSQSEVTDRGIKPIYSEDPARFTPAQKLAAPDPDSQTFEPTSVLQPKNLTSRKVVEAPGYYFERLRVQGDASSDSEGEFVLVKRPCLPGVDMPEACSLPRNDRINHPVVRPGTG